MVRTTWFAASIVLLGTWGHAAESPAVHKGLVVHEASLLAVHDDRDLAEADLRDLWKGLPRFVYGQPKDHSLPEGWKTCQIARRPLLFFHGANLHGVKLRLDFPEGLPAAWWPETKNPVVAGKHFYGDFGMYETTPRPGRNSDLAPVPPAEFLEWEMYLRTSIGAGGPSTIRPVRAGHWFESFRRLKTYADIYAANVQENFVCYAGLLPHRKWLTIKTGNGPFLTNTSGQPLSTSRWSIGAKQA